MSTQETQQFLRLANYYRHFIKDFATIAKPLHQLTEKKQPFKWTDECQQAFAQLKFNLTTAPIIALPDWSRPFIVDTDASVFTNQCKWTRACDKLCQSPAYQG